MSGALPSTQEILRREFAAEQIGKLPRSTCRECSDAPSRVCGNHRKEKCNACNNYMTTAHIHLDYVGHAAVTSRLLEADDTWTWRFFSPEEVGAIPPWAREAKGIWIHLTVAGVTRPGFGDPGSRGGADGVKIAIGDALRNAAMRFGVALDLWSKEDLKAEKAEVEQQHTEQPAEPSLSESLQEAGRSGTAKKAAKKATKKAAAKPPPAEEQPPLDAEQVPEPPEEPPAEEPPPEPRPLPKGDPKDAPPALPAPEALPELGQHSAWYVGWAAEVATSKTRDDLRRLGDELQTHGAAQVLEHQHIMLITSFLRHRWEEMGQADG